MKRQGSVPVPAFTKPILLLGRENMNRAVQGDVVVVEVFDEKEWKAPTDEVVDQESGFFCLPFTRCSASYESNIATLKNDDADNSDDDEGEDNEAIARESKALRAENAAKRANERQPTGRIVGVIKRNWRA